MMPSDITPSRSRFDRFAAWATRQVSRGRFFSFAVALVVVWVPSYLIFRDVDTWELWINTATTIGTWLLVALLQNSQQRADNSSQHKLNALAEGVAELLAATAENADTVAGVPAERMRQAARELRFSVGLEDRESA